MYMSPESMNGSTVLAWDMWSCGIVCYMLATKKMPYFYHSEDDLMQKVSKADIVRKSNILNK
jgi:serine/threonine protein kinase